VSAIEGSVRPAPLKAWWLAIRPRTLTAGSVPVAVGTGLAYAHGKAAWLPAVAALVGALLIQIGTNLGNDYHDHKSGADGPDRLGPERASAQGWIDPSSVLAGALVCFGAAILLGIYLVAVGGWPVVAIGLTSVLAGYAYTGGPYPLGYHGLGDLFVLVFFGAVAVLGTYYVQALTVVPAGWLAAIPVGGLGTAILVVNNLRDLRSDARAGKRTLIVRFGERFGRAEYATMLLASFATPPALLALGWAGPAVLLPLVSLPLAIGPWRLVRTAAGAPLNAALAGTAKLQLVFGLLFAIGLAWSAR
jgi:1,4-dihydroxy-2-naphthoate octaprenyltransferase